MSYRDALRDRTPKRRAYATLAERLAVEVTRRMEKLRLIHQQIQPISVMESYHQIQLDESATALVSAATNLATATKEAIEDTP